MIQVTRLNGEEFFVNPNQVEFLQETPDTVIRMMSGRTVIVRESAQDYLQRLIQFQRQIYQRNSAQEE